MVFVRESSSLARPLASGSLRGLGVDEQSPRMRLVAFFVSCEFFLVPTHSSTTFTSEAS
jgi:hypothetical protein